MTCVTSVLSGVHHFDFSCIELKDIMSKRRIDIHLQQDTHDTFQDTLDLFQHKTQLSWSSKLADLDSIPNCADIIIVTGENTHSVLIGEVCRRKRKKDKIILVG